MIGLAFFIFWDKFEGFKSNHSSILNYSIKLTQSATKQFTVVQSPALLKGNQRCFIRILSWKYLAKNNQTKNKSKNRNMFANLFFSSLICYLFTLSYQSNSLLSFVVFWLIFEIFIFPEEQLISKEFTAYSFSSASTWNINRVSTCTSTPFVDFSGASVYG